MRLGGKKRAIGAMFFAAALVAAAIPLYAKAREQLAPGIETESEDHSADDPRYVLPLVADEFYSGVQPVPASSTHSYIPSDFDLPLELNDVVWDYLARMQRSGGKSVRIFIERSGFYSSIMRKILWEEGCPRDMMYLSMIESGFNPLARSQVDAAGPWQFMESTGKLYDLHVTDWVDERLDVEKSTRAAARHLMDLYNAFGSWPLVLAAYNAGPNTVTKAIKKHDSNDFWELARYNDFKPETKNFIPKFYASMIIGKHPERFGLSGLEPLDDASPATIKVGPLTDLATVAELSGAPYDDLLNLNAQYLYESTPPDDGVYDLRVPRKYADGLQGKIDALPPDQRNKFARHKVRKGESLTAIARRYKLAAKIVLEANGLKSSKSVKRDMVLVVPRPTTVPPKPTPKEPDVAQNASGTFTVKYTVGSGDTIWKIAQRANVSVDEVYFWNKLKKSDSIHPGQALTLHCPTREVARTVAMEGESNRRELLGPGVGGKAVMHTVKPGDSLSGIAKKYSVSRKQIADWNNIEPNAKLKPGQKLRIYR